METTPSFRQRDPIDIVGNWELGAAVSLMDGVHRVELVCEDPAGNRGTQDLGAIVVDLQGPRDWQISLSTTIVVYSIRNRLADPIRSSIASSFTLMTDLFARLIMSTVAVVESIATEGR